MEFAKKNITYNILRGLTVTSVFLVMYFLLNQSTDATLRENLNLIKRTICPWPSLVLLYKPLLHGYVDLLHSFIRNKHLSHKTIDLVYGGSWYFDYKYLSVWIICKQNTIWCLIFPYGMVMLDQHDIDTRGKAAILSMANNVAVALSTIKIWKTVPVTTLI